MKIKIKNFVFAGFAAAMFAGHAMAAGDTIVTSKAYVDQKLGLKANTADLAPVATSGSYTDLTNTPSIPAAQVNADWDATSGVAQILNKPTLSAVATSGSYNDLSNKPTIPTVPTNVSAFTNDAGYITSTDVPAQVNADWNATSGAGEILNKPTTLAGYGITDAATSAQGALADTAVQPGDLATVATSGSYNDLTNKPTIPAAQVNADWNSTSGVSQILNKPTLSAVATSGNYSDLSGTPNLATVATSGSYTDLADKPTIPAAQVQSDWNATTGMGAILNKPTLSAVATSGNYSDLSGTPTLATVATTGDYDDLSNKPTIPAAQVQSDWNATTGMGAILNKPTIPSAVSDLTNDSGFITASDVPAQVQSNWTETNTTSKAYIQNKPTLATVATSGSYNDLSNKPTLGSAAAADTTDFATAAQGAKADTAIQPGNCTENEPCALVNNAWVRIAQVGD